MDHPRLHPQQKDASPEQRRELDPLARFLFALISATCIGLGLVAVITGYVPPRSTRFGMTNAAVGDAATVIGVITILFGMMPLGVFAKTARRAGVDLFSLSKVTVGDRALA